MELTNTENCSYLQFKYTGHVSINSHFSSFYAVSLEKADAAGSPCCLVRRMILLDLPVDHTRGEISAFTMLEQASFSQH